MGDGETNRGMQEGEETYTLWGCALLGVTPVWVCVIMMRMGRRRTKQGMTHEHLPTYPSAAGCTESEERRSAADSTVFLADGSVEAGHGVVGKCQVRLDTRKGRVAL